MAQRRAQAWLTCVTRDDSVTNALVLAESLRRTRTSKRISVITCGPHLSKENKLVLRNAFDDVFWLDTEALGKLKGTKKMENDEVMECLAKIFAFSLEIFEKCIFIGASSLIVENSDKMFEGQAKFKNLLGRSDTTDLFVFTPSKDLCGFLEDELDDKRNGYSASGMFLDGVEKWIKKNSGGKGSTTNKVDNGDWMTAGVMEFSVKKGRILMEKGKVGKPSIVQFVDVLDHNGELVETMQQLHNNSSSLGLLENLIVKNWLNIFENNVAKVLLYERNNNLVNTSGVGGRQPSIGIYSNEPIAIIGMSCRFPGAANLEEFWKLLFEAKEGICTPPSFRWKREHAVFGVRGKERETNAGFLPNPVEDFDAKFFGVSPKEALFLDPQARLLHEVLWESLENGGIDPQSLYGSHTGIFTGSWMNDYRDVVGRSTERDFFRTYMGNSMGATAARLSFLLGLTGPSIATESGCSSAIVAVDLAVKSLRSGETNLALVGGVNLLLHPFESNIIDYVISPDGRCKTFDEKADGFGRAEGCGVLVLKKLSDALRDRDNIWAMIRGSAVSQEGISRSLGTPTVHCEALAMELALKDAGVEKEQVSFVETHGTGTSVGDPMEVAAICKAYKTEKRKSPLIIGSVKTNVGHTESCSGITGIIKTVLAMQNELIPKHLNLEVLNPQINLEMIPAKIPLEPVAWPKINGETRIAGVSSFGITGTDGHVILEEPPELELPRFEWGLERPLHILKISGKTKEGLEELIELHKKAFQDEKDGEEMSKVSFADMAYTANIGRASFNHRAFVVASDYEQAIGQIEQGKLMRGDTTTMGMDTQNGKICFLFTGQGSQYVGMAKMLYISSPIFRLHFDYCNSLLKEGYGLSIAKVIWGDDDMKKELSRTIYSQISIFCVEWCLLKLWGSWGIKPDIVLGHSLGEFCAAVAAELISFEDALKLVAERSRLIDGLPRGSMLVVKGAKPEVEKLLGEFNVELDFAAENSLDQTVVAGDTEEIEKFMGILKGKDYKAVVLDATHAFHSRHMDSMLEMYGNIAKGVKYAERPSCQYVSGMEGRLLDGASEMEADYWVRHTRNQVSFMKACEALRELDCQHFVEIGPHPVLSTFVMENLSDHCPVTCYPSLRRNTDDWETILNSLGRLYLQGGKIDWSGFDKQYNRKKISKVPYHPFQRKPFWIETNQYVTPTVHPLVGHTLPNASTVHIFENNVTIGSIAYLKDHCVGNLVLFPGAGFTEMCLSAGYCVANGLTDNLDKPRHAMQLENVRIEAPLELKEGKSCRLQTTVTLKEGEGDKEGGFEVKIYHENQRIEQDSQKNWVAHATALFKPFVGMNGVLREAKWDPERIKEILGRGKDGDDVEGFYKAVDNAGLKFGEKFRTLRKQWRVEVDNGMDEIVVEVGVPEKGEREKYLVYPTMIDGMIQSGMLSGFRGQVGSGTGAAASGALRVPVGIGRLTVFGGNEGEETLEGDDVMYLHTRWMEGMKCVVFLVDKSFRPVVCLEGLEVIETNVKTIQSVLEIQNNYLPDSWEEIWRVVRGPNDCRLELHPLEELFEEEGFKEILAKDGDKKDKEEERMQAEEMRRLVYLYAMKALLELGWEPEVGERLKVKEFCERWKILGYFEKLIHFYFNMCMEENGMMEWREEEGIWEVKKVAPRKEEMVEEARILHEGLVKVDKLKVVVNIYKNVEPHVAKVLTGEESVLPLLYPMEEKDRNQEYSAEKYYQNYPGRVEGKEKTQDVAGTLLTRIWEVNGGENNKGVLRVLEVGAGTGSMSVGMVGRICEIFRGKFEYWYTDISQGFFGKAEKKLEEWKDKVRFGIFNVEEPPLEQGIPLGYFDLVLASDVLHATKSLTDCVRNIRQTIRPGGTLYFTEILQKDRGITFVFGLFEGYWRFEDFEERPYHCCVDGGKWRRILGSNGFGFVDIQEVYMGTVGCIMAEATMERWRENRGMEGKEGKGKWVVFTDGGEVCGELVSVIRGSGGRVEEVTIVRDDEEEGVEEITKRVKDALNGSSGGGEGGGDDGEMVKGVIYGWGLDKDEVDQKRIALPLMLIAQHLLNMKKPAKLWVLTSGVHSFLEERMESEKEIFNPSGATLFGMTKSLKNECPELFVRYVDLEMDSDKGLAGPVDQVLYEVALSKEGRDKDKVQVAYRDGLKWEPRFSKAVIQSKARDDLQLPPSTERYQLVLPKTKVISDLSFDVLREENGGGELGEDQIEIKVKAYALNFRDLFAIMKPSAEFERMNGVGLDFAGVVSRKGEKVDKLEVGTRVFGIHFKDTQIPSHQIVEADNVLTMPDNVTFAEAATLPAVFATSFHCLVSVAGMKEGEWVLIHTGSGGVGLAAIQLAKLTGTKIISTAGSPRKRRYLKGLGVEHVFRSRDTGFEKEVMRVTEGKGVDIVLNSLTGPGFKEASLAVVRENGRFVEMSKLEVWSEEEVKERRPDVKYTIVDLTQLEAHVWRSLLTTMREWVGDGNLSPIPYVRFDALRVRQALWYLQKARHIGKVVVTMPDVKVKEGGWNVEVNLFDEESTYVITGGMGGIGFEVCKWMLGKGARSIVLVGRGGPKPEVEREIQRLNREGNGISVMVKLGDVGDMEQCRKLFREIAEECKPIRGIHHCAGVLRDNIYGNQTWESFSATYHPKIGGSWNLHKVTVEMGLRLEHFVFYSSITAMAGTPVQSNHSSSNCFEDAMAHYRNSLGLPATTINWGQWAEVGCAKEVNVTGVLPVSVKRMLNGLEEVLRSQLVQVAFGEFESLAMWSVVVPLFKNYLDERLLKDTRSGDHGSCAVLNSDKFWEEMDEAEGKEEKMAVVSTYMKIIIRGGLRMDKDEPISDDANMKDLGVDSLMLIELKNSIQSLLGSRLTVSANMLKDCNTIRDLAECIVNKLYEENEMENLKELEPEELIELLKKDTVLEEMVTQPESSGESSLPVPVVSLEKVKTVLVTGCTGQLGPYLISYLARDYPVEKIICLVRTRKEEDSPQEKLEKVLKEMNVEVEGLGDGRVTCLRGDVAKDNLGMEEKEYADICERVDAVIHLAVKSNHLEPYRKWEGKGRSKKDARSVNVGGTLNILRFCRERKMKYLYYASSLLAVFGGNKEDSDRLCDEWPTDVEKIREKIIEHRVPAYPLSKYVGEMLIKEASVKWGVPCKIFRFPWIMGDSKTGQLNYLSNHYILRFLSYLKIKSMPMAPLPAIILPVDVCAELSLKLFWNGEAPWEIYNIAHPSPQLEVEFVEIAEKEFGVKLEMVDHQSEEFVQKLYGPGMPLEGLKEIYADFDRVISVTSSDSFHIIQGYLQSPDTGRSYFKNEKVGRWLPGWEEGIGTTMDIIKRDLKFVKAKGFFTKFGL